MSVELYPYNSHEINLREEFIDFIKGTNGDIPKQKTHLLRKIRTLNNEKIKCSCVSNITHEADSEDSCPFCLGEGYLWDESWLYVYSRPTDTDKTLTSKKVRLPSGEVTSYDRAFYLLYNENISYYDKIIELKLDSDGAPTLPYRRQSIYRIEAISDYRGDYGKREFIVLYCTELTSIRLRD